MNWLQKLQRKYGRYAITGITRYMILIYALSYVIGFVEGSGNANISEWICFDPGMILHGQIWRLITWVVVPSRGFDLLTLLLIFFLLQLGENLERFVGSFRMTVYFIGGILLTDILGLLVYLVLRIPLMNLSLYSILFCLYIMLGLLIPEAEVSIYGVFPIRMKWMLLVWAVLFLYNGVNAFRYGGLLLTIFACAEEFFALINVVIFVRACKGSIGIFQSVKQQKRRTEFRASVQRGQADFRKDAEQGSMNADGGYIHKCAICGRTDVSNPELTFRYCSKCTCGQEYCNAHLFTHEHQ